MRQGFLFSGSTEEKTGKAARCQTREENWEKFPDSVPVLLQDKPHGTKASGRAQVL